MASPITAPTTPKRHQFGRSVHSSAAHRSTGITTRYRLSLRTRPPHCTHNGLNAANAAATTPTPGFSNRRPTSPMATTDIDDMNAKAMRCASADWSLTRSRRAKTMENRGGCRPVGARRLVPGKSTAYPWPWLNDAAVCWKNAGSPMRVVPFSKATVYPIRKATPRSTSTARVGTNHGAGRSSASAPSRTASSRRSTDCVPRRPAVSGTAARSRVGRGRARRSRRQGPHRAFV